MPDPTRYGYASVAVFAVAAFAAIVILSVEGLPASLVSYPSCPAVLSVDTDQYCAENETLVVCEGANCPFIPTQGVVFHGVQFRLEAQWQIGAGTSINGEVIERNSTTYPVRLAVFGPGGFPPALYWTSPDRTVVVWWPSPFFSENATGPVAANITVGVLGP